MGERDGTFAPHRTLDDAIQHSAGELSLAAEPVWVATGANRENPESALGGYRGLWAAPGSLESVEGALAGIRFAREQCIPFFGRCGGFQHAVLEFARNVLGIADAAHQAYEPGASRLFLTTLACSIKGRAMLVRLLPGSRAHAAYGRDEAVEEYYCSHGINPQYEESLRELDAANAASAHNRVPQSRRTPLRGYSPVAAPVTGALPDPTVSGNRQTPASTVTAAMMTGYQSPE